MLNNVFNATDFDIYIVNIEYQNLIITILYTIAPRTFPVYQCYWASEASEHQPETRKTIQKVKYVFF